MTATNTAPEEKKDVVPTQYRDKYKATGGTCGDFIAVALQKIGKDGLDSLNSVKAENDIEASRWADFNPGMQRMNLANVLRGRFLKGETISILGKKYNAKHQAEDFNGKIEDSPNILSRLAGFLELQGDDRTVNSLRRLFFPKPKGPSAEERAAAKAEKDAAKAEAKAKREQERAEAKAAKDAEKQKKAEEREAARAAAKVEKDAAVKAAKETKAKEKEAAKAAKKE